MTPGSLSPTFLTSQWEALEFLSGQVQGQSFAPVTEAARAAAAVVAVGGAVAASWADRHRAAGAVTTLGNLPTLQKLR